MATSRNMNGLTSVHIHAEDSGFVAIATDGGLVARAGSIAELRRVVVDRIAREQGTTTGVRFLVGGGPTALDLKPRRADGARDLRAPL